MGSSFERIYEETLDLLRELGLIAPEVERLHQALAAEERTAG